MRTLIPAGIAGVYSGTVVPVRTTVALQLAQVFLDAHYAQGLSIAQAIVEARKNSAQDRDRSWLFYALDGNLMLMKTSLPK